MTKYKNLNNISDELADEIPKLNEGEEVVNIKDVQKYSSYIFECKKLIKEEVIK